MTRTIVYEALRTYYDGRTEEFNFKFLLVVHRRSYKKKNQLLILGIVSVPYAGLDARCYNTKESYVIIISAIAQVSQYVLRNGRTTFFPESSTFYVSSDITRCSFRGNYAHCAFALVDSFFHAFHAIHGIGILRMIRVIFRTRHRIRLDPL
jgi:hypothetical protein